MLCGIKPASHTFVFTAILSKNRAERHYILNEVVDGHEGSDFEDSDNDLDDMNVYNEETRRGEKLH